MRMRLFGLLLALVVLPSSAAADPVVVVTPGGHAVVRNDPFLTSPAITPAPASRGPLAGAASASGGGLSAVSGGSSARAKKHKHRRQRHKPQRTVNSELLRLSRGGLISASAYTGYLGSWNSALRIQRRLHGTRKAELTAVSTTLHKIAAAKLLTPSRLPALFLTLQRNAQYWKSGPLLSYGQRVEFSGSQLVWEYYPGEGIQLQVLGTFGKADGLYTAGAAQYPALRALLGEMIPLAVTRASSLTWEYYFKFDGGVPPWTSAMSQGTALEALTRGYLSLRSTAPPVDVPNYLEIAHQALRLFTVDPPNGVGVATPIGKRYVQYSFASSPGEEVINAFLQTLIGLYDYSQVSGDSTAAALFAAGNAEAQAELGSFDTGAWSLYQPGQEDTLDYHELVTGLLQTLCTKTAAPIYCATAQNFQSYLEIPPELSLMTTTLRAHKTGTVRFSLSKVSRVGIVLLRGDQTVFATSASFPYGVHSFSIPKPSRRGQFTVHMSATDLAGNFTRIVGAIALSG